MPIKIKFSSVQNTQMILAEISLYTRRFKFNARSYISLNLNQQFTFDYNDRLKCWNVLFELCKEVIILMRYATWIRKATPKSLSTDSELVMEKY